MTPFGRCDHSRCHLNVNHEYDAERQVISHVTSGTYSTAAECGIIASTDSDSRALSSVGSPSRYLEGIHEWRGRFSGSAKDEWLTSGRAGNHDAHVERCQTLSSGVPRGMARLEAFGRLQTSWLIRISLRRRDDDMVVLQYAGVQYSRGSSGVCPACPYVFASLSPRLRRAAGRFLSIRTGKAIRYSCRLQPSPIRYAKRSGSCLSATGTSRKVLDGVNGPVCLIRSRNVYAS